MRAYAEFAIKSFQNKTHYRMDAFMGIVGTVFSYIVYISIYKALYGGNSEIDGISFSMVATSFIISLGLSQSFSFNEMFLPDKINWGNISNELLKPVNFKLRLLSENIGESIFKLIFNFMPSVIFAVIFTSIKPPANALCLILTVLSIILGYLILWEISFIVQTWSFWLFSVWGIITIKNVFVNILSGILLPMWFMPPFLRNIIYFTPFYSIYFTPLQIYLGTLTSSEIISAFIMQIIWAIALWIIGDIFWRKGTKKLVVQGG